MGERLPCKQEVTSSTLVFSTRITDCALHSPFFNILGKFFPNILKRSARDVQQKNIPQREICEMFFIAPPVGLEPTTLRLTAECSTD